MSQAEKGLRVTLDGWVLQLLIDNPAKKNALTLGIYGSLAEQLKAADEDPGVRAILISGTDGCFTSGNDLGDFLSNRVLDDEHPVVRFMRALQGCTKPVVAAVEGAAVGIGTTLLLHCDLVYAGEGAFFQTPFVNLGLCPEFASSLLMPLTLGPVRAAEMLLLGERIDAKRAEAFGLINRVVAEGTALASGRDAAFRLAKLPPNALRTSKALLKAVPQPQVDRVIARELELFSKALGEAEFGEAIEAFQQKRKADFSRFS